MLVSNTDYIPKYKIIEHVGVVEANAIKAKHLGKDLLSALRLLIGGNLKYYEEMMSETREEVKLAIIKEAEALGADAIINLRYSTSAITGGASEILVYGTAVKIEKID